MTGTSSTRSVAASLRAARTWVAERAGRPDRRAELAAVCAQCGQSDRTVVHRLWPGRARYWCRRCGAVVTLADPGELVAARWPQPGSAAQVAPGAQAGAGAVAGDQSRLVAPAVRAWLATAGRGLPATLDKAAYYQLHKRFDEATSSALPPVSLVVGRLHEFAYHSVPVVDSLVDDGWTERAGVTERVVHARRWLAHAARDTCWVIARFQPDLLPDPDEVARAAERLAATGGAAGAVDRADATLLRAALFGVDGGPGLRLLLRAFPADAVTEAVAAYRADRTRPLLAATRAALDSA